MRLPNYNGYPERGVWRPLNPEGIRDWREQAHRNLMNNEGRQVILEDNQAAHRGWEQPDVDAYGNPVLEVMGPERPLEGREVTELVTQDMVAQMLYWSRTDPELFREKVKLMRQTAGLGHLTDDQAEKAVLELCRKVSEMDVQRVHEQMGLGGGWRGAVLLS